MPNLCKHVLALFDIYPLLSPLRLMEPSITPLRLGQHRLIMLPYVSKFGNNGEYNIPLRSPLRQ